MRFLALAATAALLAVSATASLPTITVTKPSVTISKAPVGTPAPKATKADVQANLEDAADKLKAAVDALAHVKDPRPPTYNFAFGGSGALLIFQLGVSAALAEYRVYTSETRWASISGGSVVSALSATGVGAAVSVSRMLQAIIDALPPTADAAGKAAKTAPPSGSYLAALLTGALLELMPPNADDLANENSRLHIWASQVDPNASTILPPSPRAHDLYPYTSRLDLAQAATASSYVPCKIGLKTADYYRGGAWIDAGAATSLDFLCASMQPSSADCIPVIAVVVGPGSPDPSFDTCKKPKLNSANTGPYYKTLAPQAWTLPTNCTVYQAYDDFGVVAEELTPDAICPGCRTQIPYTQCEWNGFIGFEFGSTPLEAIETVFKIYEIGVAEGAAWAEERGYRRIGQ